MEPAFPLDVVALPTDSPLPHRSIGARPRREGARPSRMLPPWLALAIGLLITALVVGVLVASARARDRERLGRSAEAARARVEARLAIYVALLRSAAGLVAVDPALTRAEFRTYVRRLGIREHYPGIQGIGLTLRVSPDRVAALEAGMRAQGLTAFRIHPDTARAEYHAIVYLEPLDRRNAAAIGYDMSTEAVRREAMQRARDSGEPAMSGRVTLVQEIDERPQAGFLIYVPVYRVGTAPVTPAARRASLEGFAYAPFRADDLFTGIFGREEAAEVEFRIYDGPVTAPGHLLHASGDTTRSAGDRLARITDTLPLTIAGRRWTMVVTPGPAFRQSIRYPLALALAVSGVLVSIALYVLARARRRAILRIERTRDLLGEVLEQAPVAMCVVQGPDHVFALANPRFRELVSGDPIGRPLHEVITGARSQGLVDVLDRVYRTGTPWAGHGVEFLHARHGGTAGTHAYFNVLFHPLAGDAGTPAGIIAVAVEVTAETRARREAELARQEAEAANRAKSDFLAAMSHELRTPLNAIAGYAQLMEIGIHGPVTDQQHQALDRIQRSASHLLSLINDVLNFAKLEAGRVEFDVRPVALHAAVENVVHMIEPQLTTKGLWCRVDVPEGITVRADLDKLHQILLNLLSNAVKFTEAGGITVDVATPPDQPGRICLRVADTGIGIPADRLSAIFDPFVQVNRTLSSRAEGTGLGLAISRDLARGMGAELTVHSTSGKGSVFSVVLAEE